MPNPAIDFPWKYEHVIADTQVSAIPCVLHTIVVNGLTTAGDCTVYDNPAAAGNVIAILHLDTATSISVQPITLTYDCECATGLYIDYDATLVADLAVTYK
ncbi:MAG: hypothetical protein KKC55_13955 [Gammaproteobacteria bacterium]|nr:hypothetical protein [Gammaproteobacteria bacterium]